TVESNLLPVEAAFKVAPTPSNSATPITVSAGHRCPHRLRSTAARESSIRRHAGTQFRRHNVPLARPSARIGVAINTNSGILRALYRLIAAHMATMRVALGVKPAPPIPTSKKHEIKRPKNGHVLFE